MPVLTDKKISSKDWREWINTMFYLQVDNINDKKLLLKMLRDLKGKQIKGKFIVKPKECEENLRKSMYHTLSSRLRLIRKRGEIMDVTWKGHKIQVWSKNELGWQYLPTVTQYIKTGDQVTWIPKYLYPKDFTKCQH